MNKFSGPWSTKQYQESSFTDSPLIEWTILQKSTDVLDSETVVDQTDSESLSDDYDYVTRDITGDSSDDGTSYIGLPSTAFPYGTNKPDELRDEDTLHSDLRLTSEAEIITSSTRIIPTQAPYEYISTTLHKVNEDCVYDISRTAGEIIFPDNDHLPRANSSEVLTCKWRIRTPNGPNIRLHFRKLELELGSEYLELAVGMGGNKATRLITGTKLPSDVVIEGSELWLTLKSRQKDGFTQLSLIFQETYDSK